MHPNYKKVKINNELFLYYANDDKSGKLYFNNGSNINDLNNNIFNFSIYNEEDKYPKPTLRLNAKSIQCGRIKLNVYDLGAQKSIREYWKFYYKIVYALIYVCR